MMADPLSIGPVVFLGLKVGRSPMVVKEQVRVHNQLRFFSPILDRPGMQP